MSSLLQKQLREALTKTGPATPGQQTSQKEDRFLKEDLLLKLEQQAVTIDDFKTVVLVLACLLFVFVAAFASALALAIRWRPRTRVDGETEMMEMGTPGRPPGNDPPLLNLSDQEGEAIDNNVRERLRILREVEVPAAPDFLQV